MAARFLSIRNWSQLSGKYADDVEALHRNKRNILFSQITFFATFLGLIYVLKSFIDGVWLLPAMDLTMTGLIFSCYLINESGRHQEAKVTLLSFLNIFFFFYSLITPRELGIYAFYFPLVAVAALIFDHEARIWRIFFIGVSILFLLVLLASDFDLLQGIRLDSLPYGQAFVVNMVTSLLVTAIFIYFMIELNEDSEKKLRKLTTEIREKNAALLKSNEELDRFVYGASHDIKVPINSIKGLTNLAKMDCDDVKSLSYFTKIESQTDKLGTFLLEMLDYTRNGRVDLKSEPVDINGLVEEVVENLGYMEGAERIAFKKFVRVEGVVRIDRFRLLIILNNLVSNSIKYHNYDLKDPWVKIMISKVNNTLQMMIADNGTGIHHEFKDRIFEMFFRASDHSMGSGLGLFIVKEAVEKMNGRIMLSSNPGEGACFKIDFPLAS